MIYINDSSRVWHVAKVGNDGNSGHAGQYPVNLANDAKLTIGAAVSAAASGDTIIIWPGDYAENVTFGSKTLTMVGTNRKKCRIIPANGNGVVCNEVDGCHFENLTISSTDNIGLDARYRNGITVENCDIFGAFDAIILNQSSDILLKNSLFQGKYDGGNGDRVNRIIATDCIFRTDGTYGASSPARGMYLEGSRGVFKNCIFWAERNDSSSQTCAAISTISGIQTANLTFLGCYFYAKNGANNTGRCCGVEIDLANDRAIFADCLISVPATKGYIYGVLTNKSGVMALLKNCIVLTSASGTPTEIYDLKNAAGSLITKGCGYLTTSGVITEGGSGWANGLAAALFTNGAANKLKIDAAGKVDAASIEGINAESLQKAAKMLLNKAMQNKLTGAIRYYDDDGQTVILTHTPEEGESSLTRAVS
jgi:hypothetical protein